MATIQKFSDLLVWKKSHELVLEIYSVTKLFPKEELYGITSQMRRASYSIPSNIVEGFRRKTLKDSINFYHISDASLEELKYFLFLSKDLSYLTQDNYFKLFSKCEEVGKLLTGWLKSQRSYLT